MNIKLHFSLLFLAFFLSINKAIAQTYEELENAQIKNDSIKEKKTSFFFGYTNAPFSFESTSIRSTHPAIEAFDVDLPAISLQHGITLGVALHRKNWYGSVNLNFTDYGLNNVRKSNQLLMFGLNAGYQIPHLVFNNSHFLSLESGLAIRTFNRPLTRDGRKYTRLQRVDYAITPAIRYDINLMDEKIFLFFQAKHIHEFARSSSLSGVLYDKRGPSEGYGDVISLNSHHIRADENSRLSVGNLTEFSIGLRIHF